jgi:hypothetical protein
VTEKTISEKGEQKRYYIFKITMIYENDKEEHLAICGPFDMNMQQVEIKAEDEWIRIFYEEPYAARQVNELFEKYIKEKNEQSK